MSVDALSWAFSLDLPPEEKIIMLTLADTSGEYAECYQSLDDIADRTGLSEQDVARHLEVMANRGILTVHHTPRPHEAHPPATVTLAMPGAKIWRGGR